ncbi:hypothetical protein Mapa_010029 [Marchantia paleacea]|nr:hypothetical protein Mapa_010029 [Marchantia paleacea]
MAAVGARLAWLSSYGASLSSRQPFPSVQFSRNRHSSAWSVRCSASVQPGTEVLTTESAAKADPVAWRTFAERVSGEWDGYGADFTFTGEPLELPSSVVPDAFRDWGVEVHDWQTMCPTLAMEESQDFSYRVIRLLPTVGCEADAATPYCSEERKFSIAKSYAFHTDGSYTAVWPGRGAQKSNPEPGRTGKIVVRDVENEDRHWEVEHCLVKQEGPTRNRARVLQQFRLDQNVPVLKNITLYIEQWDGPFRNGESLGGCSTSGSGFAMTAPLDFQTLVGTWQVDIFFAPGGQSSSSPKQLCPRGSSDLERTQVGGIVALPKGLWSSVKVSSQNSSSYIIEAGWMLTPDQSIVSTCEYLSSGDFKSSSIRFEKRK